MLRKRINIRVVLKKKLIRSRFLLKYDIIRLNMQRVGVSRMKILAIAPYEGLKETFKNVGTEYQCDLDVELSDLCKGVELSRRVLDNKADIIISRGGTASYVEKELPVPVVEVEVSGYDILRILTFIKDYEGKKGLIAFPQIANGARTICDILNIDISIYAVRSEGEVQLRLEQMKQENYEVVVGDVIAVQKAEKIGLNGFLLTSGEESVKKAFDQAKKLYDHLQEIKTSLRPIELYMERSTEMVAVVSSQKKLLYCNQSLKNQLKLNNLSKENVLIAFEQMEKTKTSHTTFEYHTRYWLAQLIELEHDMFAVRLRENTDTRTNQEDYLTVIGPESQLSRTMKTFLSTNNDQMKQVIEQAKHYKNSSKNVWITGAKGVGKESLAHWIHFGDSIGSNGPLAVIDCNYLKGDEIEFESTLIDSCYSVLLLNIEKLLSSAQHKLVTFITSKTNNVRFLSTCSENMEDVDLNTKIIPELYNLLSQGRINIPTLSERKEDLEVLSLSFIHEWNLELGKQVVGLRSEALELLRDYKWDGNVTQLKSVIKQCVLTANTPYIESESLELILKNDKGPASPHTIDLSGTLEEIEDRIIFKIWNEEGQNRTKTAKRLGINRTTLWRRLNRQ